MVKIQPTIRKLTKTNAPLKAGHVIVLDDAIQFSDEDFELLLGLIESQIEQGNLKVTKLKKVQ